MGRGNVWADEEIKTFIGIWGEARIQKELDGAVQNKSVFQSIALRMTEVKEPEVKEPENFMQKSEGQQLKIRTW